MADSRDGQVCITAAQHLQEEGTYAEQAENSKWFIVEVC